MMHILFCGYNRRVMTLAPRCIGNNMKANTVWYKPPALFQSWGQRHMQREKLFCLLNFALCEIFPFVVCFVLSGSGALSHSLPPGIFFSAHVAFFFCSMGIRVGRGQAAKIRKLAGPLSSESRITKLIAFSHNFLVCRIDRYFCEHRHTELEESSVKQSSVSLSFSYLALCEQSFGLAAARTGWVCKGLRNPVFCLLSSCDHQNQVSEMGRCLGQSLTVFSVSWIIFVMHYYCNIWESLSQHCSVLIN